MCSVSFCEECGNPHTGQCSCVYAEHPEQRTLVERMQNNGVPYDELLKQFMGDGELLAATLSGLSLLEVGYAQPDMPDDENSEDVVWDGSFIWHPTGDLTGFMTFEGSDGPGGPPGVKPRSMMMRDYMLIRLY